jgi:hypothetical protein
VPLRSLQPFTTRLFFSGHSDFRRRRDPRRTPSSSQQTREPGAAPGPPGARVAVGARDRDIITDLRIVSTGLEFNRLENIFRYFMQAKMTCRMFRPFSGTFSLACLGPSSWQQKCIGPSGSCNEPPRKQGRPASKATTRWRRLRPAGSPHAGRFRRQSMPQAAQSFGQPRPISRVVCAGRPHRPCFRASGIALRRHGSEWREVVVCDVRRARARRHDGHLE